MLTNFSSLSTSFNNNPSTLFSSWCVINMSTSCPEGLPLVEKVYKCGDLKSSNDLTISG